MAHQSQDEGFHEIQLNGKQLVFLFMAATVVSVVIFLCGVLVGRGVKTQLGSGSDNAPLTSVADTTPAQSATPAPAAGSDPTTVPPPPPAADDLTYFNRLEKRSGTVEQLKPAGDRAAATVDRPAAAAPPPTPPPAPKKEAAPAKPQPVATPPAPAPAPAAAAGPAEPSGPGFAVQIAALNVRSEADAIARRLSSKGYAAYVLTPVSGTPSVFRVRVGKFSTRREAESVAARLQKEEQFKPWVTR
ncbi:MAG: SPOR domain-containing protein [Vicinamibacterales bacterium]